MEVIAIICIVVAVAAVIYATQQPKKAETTGVAGSDSDDRAKLTEELQKAKAEVKRLEQELATALSGNVDAAVAAQLAEIEQLKKKITRLEEDLEDAEEDAEDYKKRIEKIRAELNDVRAQFDEKDAECRRLIASLKLLEEEVARLRSLNGQMNESLAFVQEVLSASPDDSESVAELYRNIDSVTEFVRGELRDTIRDTMPGTSTDDLFGAQLDAWEIYTKKKWVQGKTAVAFIGEFDAGKTTIVNRILSQDDPSVPLLPVSSDVTTAIPTYISGAPHTDYKFVTPDNQLKRISAETFRRVNKRTLSHVQGVGNLIKYFVMTLDNEVLNNISVLDTPGFSSNDSEDAIRTIDVINECDALFWVVDVNAGELNRSSINTIRQNLRRPLYLVISFIDTVTKPEVDAVETKLRETLAKESIPVEDIIRFSRDEPLEAIMNPIRSIRRNDQKDYYLSNLATFIDDCLKKLKSRKDEAEVKRKELAGRLQSLQSGFYSMLNSRASDSEKAGELPEFKKGTTAFWIQWSDNRYEMSEDKFSELTSLLNAISDRGSKRLRHAFEQQQDLVKDLQKQTEAVNDAIKHEHALERCRETLRSKARTLHFELP